MSPFQAAESASDQDPSLFQSTTGTSSLGIPHPSTPAPPPPTLAASSPADPAPGAADRVHTHDIPTGDDLFPTVTHDLAPPVPTSPAPLPRENIENNSSPIEIDISKHSPAIDHSRAPSAPALEHRVSHDSDNLNVRNEKITKNSSADPAEHRQSLDQQRNQSDANPHQRPNSNECPDNSSSRLDQLPAPQKSPLVLQPDDIARALLVVRLHSDIAALRRLVATFGPQAVVTTVIFWSIPRLGKLPATPLFAAAQAGLLNAVVYLVDECHADLDEGGLFYAEADGQFHVVSPLAVAASAGFYAIVSFLLQRGASLGPGKPVDWFAALPHANVGFKAQTQKKVPVSYAKSSMSASTGKSSDVETKVNIPGHASHESAPSQPPSTSSASASKGHASESKPSTSTTSRYSGKSVALTPSSNSNPSRPSPGAIEHALCHDTSHRVEVDNVGYCNPTWVSRRQDMSKVMELLLSTIGTLTRKDWSDVTHPHERASCPLLLAARHPLLFEVLEHCLDLGMTLGPQTKHHLLIEASAWGNAKAVQSLLVKYQADVKFRSDGSVGLGDYEKCYFAAAAAAAGRAPPTAKHQPADAKHDMKMSFATSVSNNYTPLLAVCSHLQEMVMFMVRYSPVIHSPGYDPMNVALLLLNHGASVSARDGKGRTSLWHVGSTVDGENVDHPPSFDPSGRKSRQLREYCFHMYNQLQRFGAVGYMGPGAPSSMLMNSSSIDSTEDDETALEWHEAYSPSVQTCAICMEPLINDAITRQYNCYHVYHVQCLEKWRAKRDVCPECFAMEGSGQ